MIFNSKYKDEDNKEVRPDNIYSRFYGQCWTFNDANTELQWKAHSTDGYGVCLKTTVERIKKALIGLDELENPPSCVIGEIQYKKLSAIRRIVEDMSRKHSPDAKIGRVTENGLISFLFLKREEYQDENELRIMVNVGDVTWSYDVRNEKATVTGADPALGALEIPSTLNGIVVTSIGQSAFSGMQRADIGNDSFGRDEHGFECVLWV